MMSACGVLCSDCPAYHGAQKGSLLQERVAEAWHRIYHLNFSADQIACGGCLGPEKDLFCTQVNCKARRCCLSKGFNSCAECSVEGCPDLEKAQSVWDSVPGLVDKLSLEDFEAYAWPYCNHRNRLAAARMESLKRVN